MSLLIQSAKLYNSINTQFLLEKQGVELTIKGLKPYSSGVDIGDCLSIPAGRYLRIYDMGSIYIKMKKFNKPCKVPYGLYIPEDFLDRAYVKKNIKELKEGIKNGIDLSCAKDRVMEVVNSLFNMENDDEEVSTLIKSINFDNVTSNQMRSLSELTEERLKDDKDSVIRSWIKYYPQKFCCYGVDL